MRQRLTLTRRVALGLGLLAAGLPTLVLAQALSGVPKPPERPPLGPIGEGPPVALPEPPAPEQASGDQRTGAHLSIAELRGISMHVRRYLQYQGDASDRTLRVVVRVELSEDGRITGGPELRSDAGESAAQRAALWQVARRALLRAAQAGEFAKLPRDKYEAWQVIDFVFTPDDVGPSS